MLRSRSVNSSEEKVAACQQCHNNNGHKKTKKKKLVKNNITGLHALLSSLVLLFLFSDCHAETRNAVTGSVGAAASSPSSSSPLPSSSSTSSLLPFVVEKKAHVLETTIEVRNRRNNNNNEAMMLNMFGLPSSSSSATAAKGAAIIGPPTTATRRRKMKIYLLGTAHVSRDSCADVRQLIQHVHPDILFLELCASRIHLLEAPIDLSSSKENNNNNNDPSKKVSFWQKVHEVQTHGGMSRASAMSAVLLTQVQEEYATKLNVTVGGEFRAALEEVQKQQQQKKHHQRLHHGSSLLLPPPSSSSCRVVLGDRPLRITMVRSWESLSWWGKIKLIGGLIVSSIFSPSAEELKAWMEKILSSSEGKDLLTESIEEMRKSFPSLCRTILEERDLYLACKLRQCAQFCLQTAAVVPSPRTIASSSSLASTMSPSTNINVHGHEQQKEEDDDTLVMVAVVGAGHVPGICQYWQQLEQQQQKEQQGQSSSGSSSSLEGALQSVIETKHDRVDNNRDIKSLMTDVVELTIP